MHKVFAYLIVCLLLVGCASATNAPAPTVTDAPTALPTSTATATPEPTPTQIPLEGLLFFDMNGSGLRDEASFNYDAERLTDERQPLQADLLKAITDYIAGHPDLKDGDLITLEEPGLSGYGVCAGESCATTGADGSFVLPGATETSNLKITDPNAGTPALEMRYINKWKGAVTVPTYTKDVDSATMATLTIVPDCAADTAALVCKLDGDTLQVRDQHLNDTSILALSDGATLQPSSPKEIGLMQGFLTLPFVKEQVEIIPCIMNYFDVIGYRHLDSTHTWENTQDGKMLNFDGLYTKDLTRSEMFQVEKGVCLSGVGDQHTGLDFLIPVGNLIVSATPTSQIWFLTGPPLEGEQRVHAIYKENDNRWGVTYGHVNIQLVEPEQQIFRNQILALSGNSTAYGSFVRIPQLHLDIAKDLNLGWYYYDPFRYTLKFDVKPTDFWGSEVSFWSSDNYPQFPILDYGTHP